MTTGARLDDLVAGLAAELAGATGDPFAMQLVVTPGPAHQRYVSQTVAAGSGHGVCAGVDFLTVAALRRRVQTSLAGGVLPHPDDDPWATQLLTRVALQAFDQAADQDWAAPLVDHLRSDEQRPGRRLATGRRVARLARRYCRDAPAMIDAWGQGRGSDPTGEPLEQGYQWQAQLWGLLVDLAGHAHPLEQHRELLRRLAAGADPGLPERIHVLVVDALHSQDVELLAGLARLVTVRVWQLDHSTSEPGAVLQRLARVHELAGQAWQAHAGHITEVPAAGGGRCESSNLAAVQRAVGGAAPVSSPAPDGTITFLPSHGPNRQVEVLRDHLCGLFEDDPTLEPRDVAVLCPNLDAYSSVLDALLVADVTTPDAHPGYELRVQVSHDRARQPNGVLGLLDRVLALRSSRATWQDLFDLCMSTPVATRWGFAEEGGQQLKQLLSKADIRWGLDRSHRAEYGIGYDRGTWLAGVESLALGAALADSPLVQVAHTAPAGYVDSQQSTLAGQLAEFVSRLRKFFHECQPASASVWNDRLQALICDVVAMPRSEGWQVAMARAALSRWAGPNADDTLLGRADVRQVIAELSRDQRRRPAFGTGALVVTGLADLTAIPHRVVVLLGLDDSSFPGKDRGLGDDILTGRPAPGVPSARELDQQHLLNAVMSATQRLVVVYLAQDPTSLDTRDQPVAITELLAAADAAGVALPAPVADGGRGLLPAQSYARGNFLAQAPDGVEAAPEPGPFSFDRRAHRAVRHLDGLDRLHPEQSGAEELLLHDFPPAPHPLVLRLVDLIAFFKHPARHFLRERARLSLGTWEDDQPTAITLEADGLAVWDVRETILERLRLGEPLEPLEEHQYTNPRIPPTPAGRATVQRAAGTAAQLASRLADDPMPHRHVAVSASVDHPRGVINLVGSVLTRGDAHLVVQTSRVKGHHVIEAWLNALALSVMTGRRPRAVIETPSQTYELTLTRPPGQAAAALAEYVALHVHGLTHPLGAPPKTLWNIRQRPTDDFAGKNAWEEEFDESWEPFAPKWWNSFGIQTTCSASYDGGCSRVSVESMGERLFGSVHMEVL
ncbi:exodeoxyribonuclease V subunit gamma [Propionibacteriaceae bacterium Y1923]